VRQSSTAWLELWDDREKACSPASTLLWRQFYFRLWPVHLLPRLAVLLVRQGWTLAGLWRTGGVFERAPAGTALLLSALDLSCSQ
jgi:hypothetical protein